MLTAATVADFVEQLFDAIRPLVPELNSFFAWNVEMREEEMREEEMRMLGTAMRNLDFFAGAMIGFKINRTSNWVDTRCYHDFVHYKKCHS